MWFRSHFNMNFINFVINKQWLNQKFELYQRQDWSVKFFSTQFFFYKTTHKMFYTPFNLSFSIEDNVSQNLSTFIVTRHKTAQVILQTRCDPWIFLKWIPQHPLLLLTDITNQILGHIANSRYIWVDFLDFKMVANFFGCGNDSYRENYSFT